MHAPEQEKRFQELSAKPEGEWTIEDRLFRLEFILQDFANDFYRMRRDVEGLKVDTQRDHAFLVEHGAMIQRMTKTYADAFKQHDKILQKLTGKKHKPPELIN